MFKIRSGFSAVFATLAFLLAASFVTLATDHPKAEEYQAQAMGTANQLGQSYGVTIHIDEYSTLEERQVLLDALTSKGPQGLQDALGKMKGKGRIALTGTLGFDINFARKIATPDGYTIKVLTSHPIWAPNSNSSEYDLSAFELIISNEKGKSTGRLLPLCQLKIDKKTNELEIDTFQNPWNLVNILDRSK